VILHHNVFYVSMYLLSLFRLVATRAPGQVVVSVNNGMTRCVFAGTHVWITDACVSTTMLEHEGGDDTVEEVDE